MDIHYPPPVQLPTAAPPASPASKRPKKGAPQDEVLEGSKGVPKTHGPLVQHNIDEDMRHQANQARSKDPSIPTIVDDRHAFGHDNQPGMFKFWVQKALIDWPERDPIAVLLVHNKDNDKQTAFVRVDESLDFDELTGQEVALKDLQGEEIDGSHLTLMSLEMDMVIGAHYNGRQHNYQWGDPTYF